MMTIAFCLLSFSTIYGAQQIGDPIVITPPEQNGPDGPRGPIFNPFTAFFQNNQIVLESSETCGLVAVEITSTTGFYYSTVFDTEDGFIIIPINGQTGQYTLLLTTQNGLHFVGVFNLL